MIELQWFWGKISFWQNGRAILQQLMRTKEEVQCKRTITLPLLLFELFPFVKLSCPGHNSKTIQGILLIFHNMIKDITPVVLMGIQNAYKVRGHSVEVQWHCTITLSCLILLLSPFYTLSLFAIYMKQDLFKVFSSNNILSDKGR